MSLIRTGASARNFNFSFGTFTRIANTAISFSTTAGKTYYVTGSTSSSNLPFISSLTGGVIDSQYATTTNDTAGAFITATGSTIAFTSDRYVEWCEMQ